MIVNILESNLPEFEKKLGTIKNKCEKHGFEFHYEIVGEEFVHKFNEEAGLSFFVKYIKVDVDGKVLFNNWNVVAKIDHLPVRNIIYTFGDFIPEDKWYHAKSFCEHCHTLRNRNTTYLLRHKNGAIKQVGSSCLKEFTGGLDASVLAQVFSYLEDDDETFKDSAVLGRHSNDIYVPLWKVICASSKAIKDYGFVPSGNEKPTKERLYHYLNNDFAKEEVSYCERIISWGKNNSADSDYMQNVKSICSSEYVSPKYYGIVASIPYVYEKEMERTKRKEAEAIKNNASGWKYKPNDKFQILVTATLVSSWYNDYNQMVNLWKFVDEDMCQYIWKTSSCVYVDNNYETPLKSDMKIVIQGTVKENTTYNGIKQTKVVRCKVFSNK